MPQSTLLVSMGEKTGHKKLPIREVARETGLSPYVIRAWEKRYAVVEPVRNHSNQRLYTEAHVERLIVPFGFPPSFSMYVSRS